jgi:hypothetical protein
MMLRTLIVALTIGVLINLLLDRPAPSRLVQVDYCVVDERVAGKDEYGVWHFEWAPMYSPCSELDRYENI